MPLFQTGDTVIAPVASFNLEGLNEDWFKWAFTRALNLMTNPANWLQDGNVTPDEASSEAVRFMNSLVINVNPHPIGKLMDYAGSDNPEGWLLCDGSAYLEVDYPQLFAVIGHFFDTTTTAGWFQVPRIGGQFRLAAGSKDDSSTNYVRGQQLGVETVALNAANNGAHTHVDAGHSHLYQPPGITGLVVAPGELPVALPNIVPGLTGTSSAAIGYSGDGEPHENMPPAIVFPVFIYAGK